MTKTRLLSLIAAGVAAMLLLWPSLLAAQPNCQLKWDPDATPIMALAGSWCASTKVSSGTLSVPGTWYNKQLAGEKIPNTTSVLYRLHVLHPEINTPLAMRLPRPYDSYRLSVNGRIVLATGDFSAHGEAARYPHYAQFLAEGRETKIEVEVRNQQFIAGGMRSPPLFGEADLIQDQRSRSLAIQGFQSGLLILMAFMQFAQFASARRAYTAQLFFGLTCLSVAIFSGLGGEHWLSVLLSHWNLAPDLWLRWAMIPLAILGLAEFSALLFPAEFHRWPRLAWRLLSASFLLACIVVEGRLLAQLFWAMEALALVMSGYVLISTLRAALHKRPNARSLTAVYGVLFITVMHDIVVDFNGQYLGNLGPTGMVLCLVWQGLLLARNNARAYRQSVELVQQLEQAEAIKDEFLANTSHELRTPLQTIIGLAGVDSQAEDQRGHHSRLIADTARRLALLVDDLMDLTRMRHQGMNIHPEPVGLHAELSTLGQLFSPVIRHRDLRIDIDLKSPELAVMADPKRLRQVLYNLLGNAVKFTASGHISLYACPCEQGIRIGVRDTGPGMSATQLLHAQQRYHQGSIASEGVGLGLPISHGILHAHGSALEISSSPGQGTDCHFVLSATQTPTHSTNAHSTNAHIANVPSTGPRDLEQSGHNLSPAPNDDYILVLDDDGCVLDTIAQLISSLKHRVLTESRVREALAVIEQRPPALLILDLMMPEASGFELLELLRQRYSPSHLPILVLSARGAEADQQRALLLGANDFLLKPCEPLELCNRAEAQLALRDNYRRRWMQRLEAQEQDQVIDELLLGDRPIVVTTTGGEQLCANDAGKQLMASGREQPELNLPLQGQRRLLLWPNPAPANSPRELLVATLQEAIRRWEATGRNRIQLAEQSTQWRVQLDGSTARSRTFDRYTSLSSLPKRPSVDRVINTARFVEKQLSPSSIELQTLLARLEALRSANPHIFIAP